MKDAEENEQHKSIVSALKAAIPEWEFEQINFVVGNRGSLVENDFHRGTKLKKLDIQEGKNDKLFADHVTPMCTCEEFERGAHACRASKLGPVERWWTQDGKLGITI